MLAEYGYADSKYEVSLNKPQVNVLPGIMKGMFNLCSGFRLCNVMF